MVVWIVSPGPGKDALWLLPLYGKAALSEEPCLSVPPQAALRGLRATTGHLGCC